MVNLRCVCGYESNIKEFIYDESINVFEVDDRIVSETSITFKCPKCGFRQVKINKSQ